MELADFILTMGVVVILGGLTVLANYAIQNRDLLTLLNGGLLITNGVISLLGVLFLVGNNPETENEVVAAGVMFAIALFSSLFLVKDFRVLLAGLFPENRQPGTAGIQAHSGEAWPSIVLFEKQVYLMETPGQNAPAGFVNTNMLTGTENNELRGFNPDNPVHMLAVIFCVYLLWSTAVNFILAGGVEGIAESIGDSGLSLLSLVSQLVLMLVVPLLGVGLLVRRNWREILDRLGLGNFSIQSVLLGLASGVGLFVVVMFLSLFLTLLLSPETLEEQSEASEALGDSINSIWLVLGVATVAAIGEEIAFRGALQPILGLWWTAIIFVLVHVQYFMTPLMLVILVVAIAFGLLRRYLDLYAALASHFSYNFIIALAALLSSSSYIIPFSLLAV